MSSPQKESLIVGAGFSGLVIAERLCAAGKHCRIIDRRTHIGGNSDDGPDAYGVLIHNYGPHYFRTNNPAVREYLSAFTKWRPYTYRVQSWTKGRYWSFPVNLKTFEQLVGHEATEADFIRWLEGERVPAAKPANSEEVILSQAGRTFYELFFRGYTRKQWNRDPSLLDASICDRIPVRTERNDAYLREGFQAMPADGYHALFDNIVAACGKNLTLSLGVDFNDVKDRASFGHIFYSGAIDEYYGHRFGALPYRSLRFEPEHIEGAALAARETISGKPGFWQPELQVNYPNEFDFTRIVEMKHATGQQCPGTTIVREYPQEWRIGGEPYYPVPGQASRELFERYAALARSERGVTFVGRLGNYKYSNMDEVVAQAIETAAEFLRAEG